MRNATLRFFLEIFLMLSLSLALAGCSSPLTTRGGGLIGGALGRGSTTIIGSAVRHAAASALIGGPIGLIGGALVGDQLMSHEHTMARQQQQSFRSARFLCDTAEKKPSDRRTGEFCFCASESAEPPSSYFPFFFGKCIANNTNPPVIATGVRG